MENLGFDFDGVFRFTNATKEDFTALWNNKEYVFPAGTCCPIVIPDESLENIQEIHTRRCRRWVGVYLPCEMTSSSNP